MRTIILMSTYNGEAYVTQQLQSILPQLKDTDRVIVRDDGSTDSTVQIIQALGDPRIHIETGPNLGFARSFLTLMRQAPRDADVYMLSDQDDVWLPNKISSAHHHLAPFVDAAALYCARLQLVDENLTPLGQSTSWPRQPSFENALTENIVTGCTAALTRQALDLCTACGDSRRIFFHDWWMYLCVSAFGHVIYDDTPTILYRQHGHNVIGMQTGFHKYLTILRFVRKHNWLQIMTNQIIEFVETFKGAIPSDKRQSIEAVVSHQDHRLRRWYMLWAKDLHRQTRLGDILLKLMLVLDLRRL